MTTANAITFEAGYARLNDIATRLNSDEVPVHEMCDLFAEGKGLEKALSAYLDEQKSRVDAIERGEGIQPFTVVAPEAGAPTTEQPAGRADDDVPF